MDEEKDNDGYMLIFIVKITIKNNNIKKKIKGAYKARKDLLGLS